MIPLVLVLYNNDVLLLLLCQQASLASMSSYDIADICNVVSTGVHGCQMRLLVEQVV